MFNRELFVFSAANFYCKHVRRPMSFELRYLLTYLVFLFCWTLTNDSLVPSNSLTVLYHRRFYESATEQNTGNKQCKALHPFTASFNIR